MSPHERHEHLKVWSEKGAEAEVDFGEFLAERGRIGRFRRRHLVPVPIVASLTELNALIAAADVLDDSRVITRRTVTVGAAFTAEITTLIPLPTAVFDAARLLKGRVDNRARVSVRQCYYSVRRGSSDAGCRCGYRLGQWKSSTEPRSWRVMSGRSADSSKS
jgi:hypothetical protein